MATRRSTPPAAGSQRPPYIPALDGLRALAALAVFAFHSSYGHCPGGFLGVDVFFAISGFLITGTLLSDVDSYGRIRFGAFYLRRARRLIPALLVMLVLAYLLWPADGPPFQPGATATLLYYANWKHLLDGPSSLGTLAHAWSLSIEEQFYGIWPLTLAAVLTLTSTRRAAARCVLAMVALLAVARVWAALRGSVWAGYGSTFARIDELLVGSAFALLPRAAAPEAGLFARLGPVLGLLALGALIPIAQPGQPWLALGGFTGVALVTAYVVRSLAAHPDTLLSRVLGWRPLRALGKRSYGFYLYHLPIVAALEPLRRPHSPLNFAGVTALRFLLTVLVAWASFRIIEEPLLRNQRGRPAR